MDTLTKALKIITNSFSLLGKKVDTLASEVKKQKAPIVNIESPDVNVNVPEAVVLEFKVPDLPAYPEYPPFPEIKIPEIKIPEIKIPEVKVNIPEIKLPVFNVPQANVTVTPTPVTFPSEMKVTGMDKLIAEVSRETEDKSIFEEVTSKRPLSVQIMDSKGNPVTQFGSDLTAPSIVGLKNTTSHAINPASEEKQDEQMALQTTLNSLTETLQILTQRLEVLASMANSGAPALRTIGISGSTTAVTGSLTTVTNLTNFGTAYPALEVSHDINNSTAILANINNVTVS